jgi:hypothetical protein
MAKHSKADLAYAAGIIDGEGCIQIMHSILHGHIQSWKVYLEINMCSKKVLDKMAGLFGGVVKLYGVRPEQHYRQFRWQLYGTKAIDAIRQMRPYLIEKKSQAALAIDFYNHQKRCKYCSGHPLSPSILAKREKMRREMQELKRRDLIPVAPAETKCENVGNDEAIVQTS